MEKVRQTAVINDWHVVGDQIMGAVYGHPSLPDGEIIVTSRVARWDLEMNHAYTVNTDYRLGTPKPRSSSDN